MSIADELNTLANTKQAFKTALSGKGIDLTGKKFSDYPSLLANNCDFLTLSADKATSLGISSALLKSGIDPCGFKAAFELVHENGIFKNAISGVVLQERGDKTSGGDGFVAFQDVSDTSAGLIATDKNLITTGKSFVFMTKVKTISSGTSNSVNLLCGSYYGTGNGMWLTITGNNRLVATSDSSTGSRSQIFSGLIPASTTGEFDVIVNKDESTGKITFIVNCVELGYVYSPLTLFGSEIQGITADPHPSNYNLDGYVYRFSLFTK